MPADFPMMLSTPARMTEPVKRKVGEVEDKGFDEELPTTPLHKKRVEDRGELGAPRKQLTPFRVKPNEPNETFIELNCSGNKNKQNQQQVVERFRLDMFDEEAVKYYNITRDTVARMNIKVVDWDSGKWDAEDNDLDIAMCVLKYQPGEIPTASQEAEKLLHIY